MLVEAEREREVMVAALVAAGVDPEAAAIQAEWLLEGDLRGHASHGIRRLPVIVARIEAGVIDPAARGEMSWRTGAALEVDGGGGLGPVVALAAIEQLLPAARREGVAVAAIGRSGHLGLLSPYAERIAAQGLVAIVLTSTEALVHPSGGSRALVGTNPIAVGVPAEPEPFVLDMATGATSAGKILDHSERGLPLEPGWAVDAAGNETRDAAAALAGAISPFGGGKGYGLAVAFGLLVAALTGTELGDRVRGTLDVEFPSSKGDLIFVLDPTVFGATGFVASCSAYLEELRSSPPQPGSEGVLIPGDRARRERERRLREGIPVADVVWDEVTGLAGRAAR